MGYIAWDSQENTNPVFIRKTNVDLNKGNDTDPRYDNHIHILDIIYSHGIRTSLA